jgi:ABC-type antimicrobial peptide transport system permease subunit
MDKFHENEQRLYLAKRTIPLEDGVFDVYDNVSYPFLEAAKEQLPEVETYMMLGASFEDNLSVEKIDYRASGTFANADFFKGFSFPVLAGDIGQLDQKPEAIAVSERLARRIWGTNWKTQAIGSTVHIHDNGDFTVEAVYEDFPDDSSIQNDFYYSFDKFLADNDWLRDWSNNGMQGVLVLRENADPQIVSDKLHTLFQANIKGENKEGMFIQRFSENYLYGQFDEKAMVSGGRIDYVRIFTIAAIFLLLISCINFVNLSTAYATKRAGEIGVRKVVGAERKTLISQFFAETAVITFLSFCIAYILTLLMLPLTNVFTHKQLSLDITEPAIWLSLLGVFIFTTILSGAYPAIVISSYKPIRALKGQAQEQKNTITFRKGLVVVQFGLTILLIVAAVVVRQQINYINHKDLGIAKEHLVYIHQDQKLTEKYAVLREQLMQSEGIEDVTLAGPSPLDMFATSSGVNWPGETIEQGNIEFGLLWTAHNFPDVFNIPIARGRYYPEGSNDTVNIVVNEKALEVMDISDPIGKTIEVWKTQRRIIGVLKDFHNRSLYEPIQPSVFFLSPENAGMMFVKINGNQTAEALASIETTFKDVLPDVPLHYDFVDQEYAAKYESELLTGTLASYFAFISILISCLGLFGLATFMARQRTKEIGIRKVLGASLMSITALITTDFIKLVLLSIFIASPLAYFLMQGWLRDFEYKIDFQWWVLGLAGSLAVVIAMLTISTQAIRAAMANPVKSLRTE